MIHKLIGDRAFYKRLFLLMLPIMIQNGITNFVNMLDNIMIGAVGTAQMTGVAVTNQLFFVFNLCIFGVVSGAGIFGAQYFGAGDTVGVQHTFRFKLFAGSLLTIGGIALLFFGGDTLIGLYMQGEQNIANVTQTAAHAHSYMRIMLVGMIPYAVTQCYSATLREGAKPTLPMVSGLIAVIVNLAFNYILIFGKFGAPALGVDGAAIATVLSRFVELAVIVIATHANGKRFPFMVGVYRTLGIPFALIKKLIVTSLPLILNETMWAAGIAVVNQSYSTYGLSAIAACNISQTFWNVFSIAYLSLGTAISIILGQLLGADKLHEAKSDAYKLIACSFVISALVGVLYIVCAEFIPLAYNTTPDIRHLATRLMQITALAMPFDSLAHAAYFTLRSGGKMMITLIFDCGFMWGINVTLAFFLSRFTAIPFIWLFLIIQAICVVKAIFGIILVRNGFWIKNIVNTHKVPS